MGKWYRILFATGPGYAGRPLVAHARRLDAVPGMTQVAVGQWTATMPRDLVVALVVEWREETDQNELRRLPA